MTTKSTRNLDTVNSKTAPPTFNVPLPVEPVRPSGEFAVGDINSSAKGSGARANNGKPQMDLIPVAVWLYQWKPDFEIFSGSPQFVRLHRALKALSEWQEGDDDALARFFRGYVSTLDMDEAVKVFEFGAEKYKAWNWAKGMQWSVPTGCILRHAKKIIVDQEFVDAESEHSHMGHIICNMIMLERYVTTYPAGDDRPPS